MEAEERVPPQTLGPQDRSVLQQSAWKEEHDEDPCWGAPEEASPPEDSVRLYLKEMGAVPLLQTMSQALGHFTGFSVRATCSFANPYHDVPALSGKLHGVADEVFEYLGKPNRIEVSHTRICSI